MRTVIYSSEMISTSTSSAVNKEFETPEFNRKFVEAEFVEGVEAEAIADVKVKA